MKKSFIYLMTALAGCVSVFLLSSCDDDSSNGSSAFDLSAIVDDTKYSENATNWGSYMVAVAQRLKADATTLYNDWNTSYNGGNAYKDLFTNPSLGEFTSARAAAEQIIDGCIDIANEVGTAKIGDPRSLYNAGKYEEAVYAVESWYSYHSRDDYKNNINSIRNAYFGSLDGSRSATSLSAFVSAAGTTGQELDTKVQSAISSAISAIDAIPQPFRNNIASGEVITAMEACAALNDVLTNELKPFVTNASNISEANLQTVINDYTDKVVLPTYLSLKNENETLLDLAQQFKTSPSDAAFEALAAQWIKARKYWESSEAFLFGPVADKGLDPNMDSWPLDKDQIMQILSSGDFSGLDWTGEYNEESDDIAAAQGIRGFHTLEFLIFKNGEARRITD